MFDDGDIEYKYIGPHQDIRKTKELQDQGKKINLSLSEVIAPSSLPSFHDDVVIGTPQKMRQRFTPPRHESGSLSDRNEKLPDAACLS